MMRDFQIKEMLQAHAETVMREQYKDKRLSVEDIAEIWGCSPNEILETLQGFGILKNKGE